MDASQDLEANPDSAGDVVVVSWGFLAAPLRFIMLSRYDRNLRRTEICGLFPGHIRQR
jgi:hypothetical protein